MIKVEVAYATPEKQLIIQMEVAQGTTLRQAVLDSGMENEFPDLDVREAPLGIFGRKVPKPEAEILRDGDRIEIYRPLLIDPKQARLNRAAKSKAPLNNSEVP